MGQKDVSGEGGLREGQCHVSLGEVRKVITSSLLKEAEPGGGCWLSEPYQQEEGVWSGGCAGHTLNLYVKYRQTYKHTSFLYSLFLVSPLNNPANDRNSLLYFALPM